VPNDLPKQERHGEISLHRCWYMAEHSEEAVGEPKTMVMIGHLQIQLPGHLETRAALWSSIRFTRDSETRRKIDEAMALLQSAEDKADKFKNSRRVNAVQSAFRAYPGRRSALTILRRMPS
jgi:hypothetical protein